MPPIMPYVALTTFTLLNPVLNSSSRVYARELYVPGLDPDPVTYVTVTISDAVLSYFDVIVPPPDPVLAPIASFSASSLIFGTVPDGSVGDLILTITNTGTAPLIITGATATGDFSVTEDI